MDCIQEPGADNNVMQSTHYFVHFLTQRIGRLNPKMKYIYFFIACFFLPTPAKTEELDDALEIADSYNQAITRSDANEMSRLMHPEALTVFRDSFSNAFESNKKDLAKKELLPGFSVASIDEFNRLSDREVYMRMIDYFIKLQPGYTQIMLNSEYHLLDKTLDGDLLHVHYRTIIRDQGEEFRSLSTLTLKKHKGYWRVMLDEDSELSSIAIKHRYK